MALKNLANCTPTEFFTQTALIKKAVEKWLTATDIRNISKVAPDLLAVSEDMDGDAVKEIAKKNVQRRKEQTRKNISRIFDAIFAEHPRETMEILASACFVPVDEIDNHTMAEYIAAFNEMLGSEEVLGFFISFLRWVRILIKEL